MTRKIAIAFTGHQTLMPEDEALVASRVDMLAKKASAFITGACIGVDSFIARYVDKAHPSITNVIVVPSYRGKVCPDVLALNGANTLFEWMPSRSDYRMRNQTMVDQADLVEAFWCGNKCTGTWMTMNMARRAKKLGEVTMIKSGYRKS